MSLPLSVYHRLPKRHPYSLGFKKYAVELDGATGFIDFGDPAVINNIASRHTVGVWAKLQSTGASQRLVVKHTFHLLATNARAINVWQSASTTNPGSSTPNYLFDWGEWIYVVVTYDDATDRLYRIYLNAEETPYASQTAAQGTLTGWTLSNLLVGKHQSDIYWLKGLVGSVWMYNRILSRREIYWNMLNYHNIIRDGLVFWAYIDEGSGSIIYDKSGYGNNGSLSGGYAWNRTRMHELRAEVGL